jgi:coatomer subunit gamma
MEPLGGSQNAASGTTVHTLQLSGLLTGGGGKILARCRMTFSRGEGVTLELGVRGEKEEGCRLVIAAIGG